MLLVVDIGNTNTHLGLCQEGRIEKTWDTPTSVKIGTQGLLREIQRHLPRGARVSGACVASVVPDIDSLWWSVLQKKFRLEPVWVTAKLPLGMEIRYKPVSAVGADRIANAVGGFKKYGGPLIIVDFGTAVTFDVIDAQGNYIGGVIGPGIGLTIQALHEKTALLPKIELKQPLKILGENTVSAMQSGIVVGFCGMIKEVVEGLRRELHHLKEFKVVATGGYCEPIAKQLPFLTEVNPLLTLEGLCEIYERVKKT